MKRDSKITRGEWETNGWYNFGITFGLRDKNPWWVLEKGNERAIWESETGRIIDHFHLSQ